MAGFSRIKQAHLAAQEGHSATSYWLLARLYICTLVYADETVLLSTSYKEMQDLLEAVNRHAAAFGVRINASKPKVMSTLILGEQPQAVLLDGEPLEDVDKFKYLDSIFIANGQSTKQIRSRITAASFSFSRLQSCFWSWREKLLCRTVYRATEGPLNR